ncbi:MAG: hypothetical protein LBR80_08440 [Deltaproteobacteria bacterium]|nr:hypothetical protein [Deltaproteobacteria bacterium]
MSAPPFNSITDDAASELAAEGDYSWLDLDWDGFRKTVLDGNSLDSAIYLSRLARRSLLRDQPKAALSSAAAGYPHLEYGQGPNSEEAIFCEETMALAGFSFWGWSRANCELADLSLRSSRHLGQGSPQTLRVLASRAALAAKVQIRELSRELYADLVTRDIKSLGPTHRFTIADRISFAVETGHAGDHGYALGLVRACADDAETVLGAYHPLRCIAAARAGDILSASGAFSEAASALSAAVELHLKVFGPDHERTLDCAGELGRALFWSGHPELAENVLLKTTADYERSAGSPSKGAETAWERLLNLQDEMGFLKPTGDVFA